MGRKFDWRGIDRDLVAAFEHIAKSEPPLNRLNRVPVLCFRQMIERPSYISLDVVDDAQRHVGESPRIQFGAPDIEWWGVARKVTRIGDIPRRVGEAYEMIYAKMLGLVP